MTGKKELFSRHIPYTSDLNLIAMLVDNAAASLISLWFISVKAGDGGFLTARRQVTRAHKGWALGSVTLHNEVIKQIKEDITSPPPEGVFIYGLYLDGAGWDKRKCRLCEPTAKVLFTPLTVVHMYAINSTAPKDPRLYQCPVYKKPNRADLTYISNILLKTTQSPDHWILRGVAALCDIK